MCGEWARSFAGAQPCGTPTRHACGIPSPSRRESWLGCVMQVFRHVLEGDNVENTYNVIEGLHSYDLHLNHDYRKCVEGVGGGGRACALDGPTFLHPWSLLPMWPSPRVHTQTHTQKWIVSERGKKRSI